MNSFAKNLRKIMNDKNLTGEKLGELIGVTKATVIHWSNGRRFPKENHIKDIVKVLNINYDDLFLDDENKIQIKTIPLIGLESCGVPQEYALDGYEPVPVSADIYRDGMYAVKAEGNSMSPKINHNNLVYCLPNETIDNGHIVHYTLNGESGIKKYKLNEKGNIISLVPINSDYDIITVHADEPHTLKMARVMGVVDTEF